jgi:hypothetical protein
MNNEGERVVPVKKIRKRPRTMMSYILRDHNETPEGCKGTVDIMDRAKPEDAKATLEELPAGKYTVINGRSYRSKVTAVTVNKAIIE